MHRLIILAVAASLALTGCATAGSARPAAVSATASAPQVIVEKAWVRTTEGAKDATMTGAFLSLVNPGDVEITLVKADCPLAGMTQLHEMAKEGDAMVMREVKSGIAVPAGGHVHLVPGGYHVMLMMLKQPLRIGDEVSITLTFSTGQTTVVTALVKKFTEEEDHYHSPTPTPSQG